jgi:serine/threonine-protein kinase RsbW
MGVVNESSKGLSLEAFLEPEGRDAPLMCVRVPARAALVGSVRKLARLTLQVYEVTPSVIEAAVLIVSEMVTNVVRHNKWDLEPVVVLIMSKVGPVLCIELLDSEPAIPQYQEPTEHSEAGRGLQLIHMLSDRWGTDLIAPDGKLVWCELTAWPDEANQV